jgi:hypothetical protein
MATHITHHSTDIVLDVSGSIHNDTPEIKGTAWVSLNMNAFEQQTNGDFDLNASMSLFISNETAKNLKAFLNNLDLS